LHIVQLVSLPTECLPAAHSEHDDASVTLLNAPAGQGVHGIPPPVLCCPAMHWRPAAVTDPATHPKPAAAVQLAHDDRLVVSLYLPASHSVHAARPPAPYRPAAHGRPRDELEPWPHPDPCGTEQGRHSDAMAGEYVPSLHNEHFGEPFDPAKVPGVHDRHALLAPGP
jgi:hypothetical protein